jgi:hypothetical protein
MQRCQALVTAISLKEGMGFAVKMRGLVVLVAALALFAASVSACTCPTHAHGEPKPEATSCHSHAEQDAPETSHSLAAGATCSCGESIGSRAITPKPDKRTSLAEKGAAASAFVFRAGESRFEAAPVIEHPPPELSRYSRLRFANLPSRAPPRLLS